MAPTALIAPARNPAPKAGRPPKALTERRLTLICEKIANGVPMTTAAIAAGIPRRTFQVWLAAGRAPDAEEPYASMAERIEAALAIYEESRIDQLHAVALAEPRVTANVAMWELERRFRDDWADPRRGGQVNVQVNIALERRAAAEEILLVASRALADDPEALERLTAALRSAGGDVVEGEARELPEAAG